MCVYVCVCGGGASNRINTVYNILIYSVSLFASCLIFWYIEARGRTWNTGPNFFESVFSAVPVYDKSLNSNAFWSNYKQNFPPISY